ncbi:elongation factor P hydroxylase [Pseudomonas sp. OIL-1]|uniref:elongation factor P hydroxylase n=1 Tax=Pseudomonas sp. OIL-1 TaxID=2706126 RepID=UPI0013A71165|nr:elongation factor P hydroxylase [Pseudomonas sp. OIL-1]QIB51822.1 elongation factor P hydroxylase [Pseudomonas sp. OIL-1]
MNFDCKELVQLFERCFLNDFNTVLVPGAEEPEYLPADETSPHHRILFTRDYFRSALHEISHWCVAGPQRRLLPDFGYWYAPDGRTAQQQQAFEQVEVKPQALEWLFCEAAGHPFRVSLDNLSGEPTDPLPFKRKVVAQVHACLAEGVSERPQRFIQALLDCYRPGVQLTANAFRLDRI